MEYSNNLNEGATNTDTPVKPATPKKTTETESDDEEGCFSTILEWVSLLVAFPLFLFLSNILPNPDWFLNIDRILLFIATVAVVYYIANTFVIITTLGLAVGICYLTYGSIASGDHYGWSNAVFDYVSIVHSLKNNNNQVDYIVGIANNGTKKKIKDACDYYNPEVRDYALQLINENPEFKEAADKYYHYREFVHACAMKKAIKERWHYVDDPVDREIFQKASQTIKTMSGDCDDHSILLASLVKSIGGVTRIVLTEDHAYPEIRMPNNSLDDINILIDILFKTGWKSLDYHQEGDYIWLNMDYTGKYPGCNFLEGRKHVSIIYI